VKQLVVKDFQSTPLGLWKRAKEFAEAARIVADASGDQLSVPACYLWGHSIELSLKAFLFDCGVPLQKLKSPRDFGNDLKALVDEAVRYNIKRKVHLNARELGEISLLSDEYKAKRLEYHEAETYMLPYKDRTKRIAEKLVLLIGDTLQKTPQNRAHQN
jgi:HEPN domain-containing protein